MTINIDISPSYRRFQKALWLEEDLDRIPLFDFGIGKAIRSRVIGREFRYTPQDEVDFWLKAGYDYINLPPIRPLMVPRRAESGSKTVYANPEDGIKTLEQFRELEAAWADEKAFANHDWGFSSMQEILRRKPAEMGATFHIADIFTHTWMATGFTNFSLLLYEDPGLIAYMFNSYGSIELKLLRRAVELFGQHLCAIIYSDDIAYTEGLLVSPTVLRQYLFPWMQQIGQISSELNVPFIYHTDGRLWEVFPDLARLGVNGIQPLEPKSMDPKEVKRKWGDTFCLMGNIDVDRLSRGTPAEIEAMVKDRITTLGKGGGYCVGSSNTVPDYVAFENYKTMIEATFRYGGLG